MPFGKQPELCFSPVVFVYFRRTGSKFLQWQNLCHHLNMCCEIMDRPKRVAIVHEWLTSMRGGEKCVEALCEIFPGAEIFTLLHVKDSCSTVIERMPIHTSFVQRLPFAKRYYRHYLPLFPMAIERFDLDDFDLVISSNHCVAKGVRVSPKTLHICYCYTPMRYIWGLYDEYFGKDRAGVFTRLGMRLFLNYLRHWDVRTASNPNHFVAISEHIRERIKNTYNRDADVIFPPVNTSHFHHTTDIDDYFLIVSAFVPYKRIDLAIEAFNQLGERLIIVGDGPDVQRLRVIARKNIEFVGWQPDEKLTEYYARCRAVIFPGEEDFGIVPVEAMASGRPVIAYAKGGALETVVRSNQLKTGVLFDDQTVESLIGAVRLFEQEKFDSAALRSFALSFDREVYKERMLAYISHKWSDFRPHPSKR
jgi:glycosyltransferase involved in cell wall biosynthesis